MKNSKWIWLHNEQKNNEYIEFLTSFVYKNGKSKIKISVDTEYALFINGEYVTSGQYADFPWYKVYDEIDITSYLTEGENEVKFLVWFMGDNNYCHYVNRPGLKFEITCDGKLVGFSNEKTLCRPCPYLATGDGVKKLNRQLGYSFIWEEKEPSEYGYATEVYGLPMIGKLKEGLNADITIFDYKNIKANCDYDHPFRRNDGIEYVIVNGGIAVEHGEFTGLKNGRVLRMKREK